MTRAPRKAAARDDAEEIEADRLAGFPHPRDAAMVHGHEAAERTLREAFDGGRMHHGWLLTGLEGVGKATLAYAVARYVLATPAERATAAGGRLAIDPGTSAARLIAARSHPGLLVIRHMADAKTKRVSAVIRVDDVRRLKSFLQLTAADGGWRVVIVDPADDLNPSSANALLKSLEEPPPRTLFLLVPSQPGGLLPTILSRCRRLDLPPLPPHALLAAVTQALAHADEPRALPEAGDERARLMALAQGSARRLIELSEAGGLALYERLLKLVSGLPDLDMAALHALGEELGPVAADQRFETFYGLLLDLIPRLVRAKATGRGSAFQADIAAADHHQPLARAKGAAQLLGIGQGATGDDVALGDPRQHACVGTGGEDQVVVGQGVAIGELDLAVGAVDGFGTNAEAQVDVLFAVEGALLEAEAIHGDGALEPSLGQRRPMIGGDRLITHQGDGTGEAVLAQEGNDGAAAMAGADDDDATGIVGGSFRGGSHSAMLSVMRHVGFV